MDEKITEKVYCYDHPSTYNNNHDALIAAMMSNNRQYDPYMCANMFNQNSQWNNPFAYLIWMMFAGRFMGGWNEGWGFNGQNTQNVEMQNQLQAIRSQLQNNQNSDQILRCIEGNSNALSQLAQTLNCDFNSLKDCCCDIRTGIARFSDQMGYRAEQVIAAMERGNSGILQAVSNCCCETQKELLRMQGNLNLQICQQTNELRNGQRDLGVAMSQGFSQLGFQAQQDKCDIIRANDNNTQKILDTLTTHWSNEQAREIQDLKNENANLKQTQYLSNMIRNYNGCDCNCNNSCGNGCGL